MSGAQRAQSLARMMVNELTPLLSSDPAVAESLPDKPSWKDRQRLDKDAVVRETRRMRIRNFVLDAHRTAGLNSEEALIRISASIWHNTKAVILSDNVNFFLLFLPLGIISSPLKWDPATVFILNFYAIIPLTSLVSFATRDEFVGRLLHTLLSNVAEIVVSLAAVVAGSIDMAESILVGMILSNLFLVGGSCFFLGGIEHMRDSDGEGMNQEFRTLPAKIANVYTVFTTVCLVIPDAVALYASGDDPATKASVRLNVATGGALLCYILYLFYLIFSMRTHANLYEEFDRRLLWLADDDDDCVTGNETGDEDEDANSDDEAPASPIAAAVVLSIAVGLLVICAGNLIRTTEDIMEKTGVNREFISFILIPSTFSTARNIAAVNMARDDHMDLAFRMAVEPSIQVGMLILPSLVLMRWVVPGGEKDMSGVHVLPLEDLTMTICTTVFATCVAAGDSTYFQGALLLCVYAIIAMMFWLNPIK